MATVYEDIIRMLVRNHGVEILTFADVPGSSFASFGDSLNIEVTEEQAAVLAEMADD